MTAWLTRRLISNWGAVKDTGWSVRLVPGGPVPWAGACAPVIPCHASSAAASASLPAVPWLVCSARDLRSHTDPPHALSCSAVTSLKFSLFERGAPTFILYWSWQIMELASPFSILASCPSAGNTPCLSPANILQVSVSVSLLREATTRVWSPCPPPSLLYQHLPAW